MTTIQSLRHGRLRVVRVETGTQILIASQMTGRPVKVKVGRPVRPAVSGGTFNYSCRWVRRIYYPPTTRLADAIRANLNAEKEYF